RQVILQGFGNGTNQGVISILSSDGLTGVTLTDTSTGNGLTNPFSLGTDGTNIYATNNFGITGQGQLLRYAPTSTTSLTSGSFTSVNLAASAPLQNPLEVLVVDANNIFVSEYANRAGGGCVRRFQIASGVVTESIFFNSVDYPAGLATDGTNLFVASNTASGALGAVYKIPLSTTTVPVVPGGPGVTSITAPASFSFNYPARLAADSSGGIVVGSGISVSPGPGTGQTIGIDNSGATQGVLYYIAPGADTAQAVMTGLPPIAGLAVTDGGNGQDTVGVTDGTTSASVRQISFLRSNGVPTQHLLLAQNEVRPITAAF
ncbi:unnamed protein product, partial [Phaeothamnion confervicola]